MKDDLLSRAMRVRDPDQVAVFASSKRRRLLMLFATGPLSVAEAAARANLDLKRLHYHVQKMTDVGLLEVCARRARAGRAVKLYRAISDVFFIPEHLLPRPVGDDLAQELRNGIAKAASKSGGGFLLTVGASGEPLGRILTDKRASPDAFEMWRILRLSRADAARLRSELESVLQRFGGSSDGRGHVYLIHTAAVRRQDETGAVDNP